MRARGPWSWWMVATAALVLVTGILVVALELSGGGRRWTDDRRIDVPVRGTSPRDVLWEPPQAVLVPELDDAGDVYAPFSARDGLELFLVRGRARGIAGRAADDGGGAGAEILLSRRGPDGWSTPEPIAAITSPADELHPVLSPDGRWLYFSSDRPGGAGGFDLWRVARDGERWGTPEPLGERVNTRHDELAPAWSPDGRRLWFSSDRPRDASPAAAGRGGWGGTMRAPRGGRRDFDLYVAAAGDAGLATARRIAEASSDADDGTPAVSPAGDFLYFASDRAGGAGGFDLYRMRLADGLPGEDPVRALDGLNSPADELDPALDLEGFGLLFASNRPGDAGAGSLEGPGGERPWRSISREVRTRQDELVARFDWGAILPAIPWLLALLLLALLAWLLRALHVSGRLATIGLLTRCLLASAMAHLILALLLGAWTVSGALADGYSDRTGGTARLSSAGIGGGLERQLFGPAGQPLEAPAAEARWSAAEAAPAVSAATFDVVPTPRATPPAPADAGTIAMDMRPAPERAVSATPMSAAASRPAAAELLAVPPAPVAIAGPMATSTPAPAPAVSAPRRAAELPLDLASASAAAGMQAALPPVPGTTVAAAELPAAPRAASAAPGVPTAAPVPRPPSPRGGTAAARVAPSRAIAGAGGRPPARMPDVPGMPGAAAFATSVPEPSTATPRAPAPEPSTAAPLEVVFTGAAPPMAGPAPAAVNASPEALVAPGASEAIPAPSASATWPNSSPGLTIAAAAPSGAGPAAASPPMLEDFAELVPAASAPAMDALPSPPSPVSARASAVADVADVAEDGPPAFDDVAARATAPMVTDAVPLATAAAVAPPPSIPPVVELELHGGTAAPPRPARWAAPSADIDATALAAAGRAASDAGQPQPQPLPPAPAMVLPGPSLPVPAALAVTAQDAPDQDDETPRVEAAIAAAAREAGLTRVIIGRVLDEETGRPLPGAEVRLDVRDADTLVAPVDEAGWYLLLAPDGPSSVAITATRAGHLPASANVTADDRRGAVVRRDLRLERDAGGAFALEAAPRVRHVGDDEFSGLVNSRFQRASDGPEVTIVFALDEAWVVAARARGTVALSTLVRGAQRDNPVRLNGRRLPRGLDGSPPDGRFGEVQILFPAELLRVGENVLRIGSAPSGIGRDIDDFEFVNVQLEAVEVAAPAPRRRRRVDL